MAFLILSENANDTKGDQSGQQTHKGFSKQAQKALLGKYAAIYRKHLKDPYTTPWNYMYGCDTEL